MVLTHTSDNVRNKRKNIICKEPTSQNAAFVKALLKLKQQQEILEKGLNTAIKNMKVDSHISQDILQDCNAMLTKRQNLLDSLHKSLETISTELISLKHNLKNPEEIQQLDTNVYKEKLLKLLKRIQDFKTYCFSKNYIDEQKVLETQFNAFLLTLEKYESLNNERLEIMSEKKEYKVAECDYKEIQDFHVLVAKTGHMNNWADEDHLLFLKMRSRYNKIPALISAMQHSRPDLSTESIINHEAWYKVYLALREKQRLTVKDWKRKKEDEKLKTTKSGSNLDTEGKRNSNIKSIKLNSNIIYDRKKELIKNWKIEKEKERVIKTEKLKMEKKLNEEKQENQRQRRLLKTHASLNEFKKKKPFEDLKKSENIKSFPNSNLIQQFRKQNEKYMNRRKTLISQLKISDKREKVELKRCKFNKLENTSNLLKTTKAWNEKCKIRTLTTNSCNLYIKDIPKSCFRWRNEESNDL